MNAVAPIVPQQRLSILQAVANRYSMEPAAFEQTLRATVVPQNATREQFAACLVVANEYRLNPLTKEIYFFPAQGGDVVPMVGVNGWCRIINEHPAFDGMEFDTSFDGGKPFSVTCRMYRKDRARPVAVTEFHSECARATDPWKTTPARMLRHKAMIQAARYAFGFSGIYDEDDAAMIRADIDLRATSRTEGPTHSRDTAPAASTETKGQETPKVETAAQPARRGPSSAPKGPPSAPVAGAAKPAGPAAEPVKEAPNWPAELEAYANTVAACEAHESLAEAVEGCGGIFDDAPAEVVAKVRKIEADKRAELGPEEEEETPAQALMADLRASVLDGLKAKVLLGALSREDRALVGVDDEAGLLGLQKDIEAKKARGTNHG